MRIGGIREAHTSLLYLLEQYAGLSQAIGVGRVWDIVIRYVNGATAHRGATGILGRSSLLAVGSCATWQILSPTGLFTSRHGAQAKTTFVRHPTPEICEVAVEHPPPDGL